MSMLRAKLPAPFVAAMDSRHATRISIRDTNDHSDGSKHGRWVAQAFRARPVPGVTVWHHPSHLLDADNQPWILAFEDETERTGFKDELDLVDWILLRIERTRKAA